MHRYLMRRILLVVPTLVGAAALVFLLMRLIPGDICAVRLGGSRASFSAKALSLRHADLGLDRPGGTWGRPGVPPMEYVRFWQGPLRNLSMAILPALTVGYRYSAVTMRMTRSAMLEVMREDYIRTARAKGLLDRIIINRHALKNAFLPVVTLIGIEFAFLIGGLVVTEQVFNLNGIGRLFVLAVQNQDYTLTQALVMLTVVVFVFTNLVVDLFYAWLDPRIRYA